MNSSQLNSFVRTILKMLGTALAAHGATKAASWLNAEDVIGVVTLLIGVVWSHLHHSDTETTPPPASKLPPVVLLALLAPLSLWLVSGCVPLQPGADPLVVNCERTETIAKASFDLVLHIDAAHRDFWRTNAPLFHDFCETLREPHTIGTNTLPFCSATLLALDNIKLDYQASRVSSNALFEAITTVNSLSSQASTWLTIVTNQP